MVHGDERILRPDKWKLVPFLLLSLAFAVIGIRIVREGSASGWLAVIGFSMSSAALAVMLLSRSGDLRLDADRFTIRSVFGVRSYRWRDIERFVVAPFGFFKIVAFTPIPQRRGATAHGGVKETLPDTYGMPAEELADLMNQWRERHAA
jgi:hypothetical protein